VSATRPGPGVAVYDVQDRRTTRTGETTGKARPWVVRWKVGATETSKAFAHKAAARDLHSRLSVAASDGLRFSTETLLPEAWSVTDLTVAEWAHRWFRSQWARWAPRTRSSAAEVLAEALPLLVGARAAVPDDTAALSAEVRAWLADGDAEMPAVLRHAVALSDLTAARCTLANDELLRRDDGALMAPATAKRYRGTMRSMLAAAVAAGHLDAQVWPAPPKAKTKKEKARSVAVDPATLPSWATVAGLLPRLVNHKPTSRSVYASCALMAYLGLRPGEAVVARAEGLTLPDGDGWGSLAVTRAAQDAGDRWTEPGEEEGPTKTSVDRVVPVPPVLVAILRDHLDGRSVGLIAPAANGGPLRLNNLWRAWTRVQGDGARWDLYDLRHAAATEMIQAGAPLGEVARRLGHSVAMLTEVYAGVLEGDEATANARIEEAMGRNGA
jgi:integrase